MEVIISNIKESNNSLTFNVSNIDVCFINSLRRIILNDIPCTVFRTFPHNKNKCKISSNTTRMNNEIIKQRLSCIPIYLSTKDAENYLVEIAKVNNADEIDYVTTKDIVIKEKSSGNYVTSEERDKVFPPDPLTGDYIDIVRLRPSESLSLTMDFDVGTAGENACFNVVSKCTFWNKENTEQIDALWKKQKARLLQAGLDEKQLAIKKNDFKILEGQRIYHKNQFNFVVETIGQYSNIIIVKKACDIMIQKIENLKKNIRENLDHINSTKHNDYTVELVNHDATIGIPLKELLYTRYYGSVINFVGFDKPHPHIDISIIRLIFINDIEKENIIDMILETCDHLIEIYTRISSNF